MVDDHSSLNLDSKERLLHFALRVFFSCDIKMLLKSATVLLVISMGIICTATAKKQKRDAAAAAFAGTNPNYAANYGQQPEPWSDYRFPPFAPFAPFAPFPPFYPFMAPMYQSQQSQPMFDDIYKPFPWFNFPPMRMIKPWYEGDNVCKEEKVFNVKQPSELDDFFKNLKNNNFQSSFNSQQQQCEGNNGVYGCIKKSVDSNGVMKIEATKYECCYGFVFDGSGCKEINLKDTLPTLRSINAMQFVNLVEQASMTDMIYNGNYTIFSPPNSVLEDYFDNKEIDDDNEILIKHKNRRVKKKMKLHKIISNHMIPGFYSLDDFSDGKTYTMESQNFQVRTNVYYIPQKVVTVNCVPIIKANHFARNGIIHKVEKMIPVSTRTVADIIAGDNQFSIFKGMLGRAGLVQMLRDSNKSFTIFAPTDTAFQAERKLNISTTNCIYSIIRHHIVGHVVCSSAIPQYARSFNLNGELLSLSRSEHNKLYVDDVQIVVKDLMATNGVVHIIDGVLTTRRAKTISHVLEEYGLNEFLLLLDEASLKSLYDSLENVTFFIPSNEAIKAAPKSLLESLMNNTSSLFSVLLYHVTEGMDDLKMPDQILNSKLDNATIRVQMSVPHPYAATQMLVQCSTVLSHGNKICGGTLHIINKLLLPPRSTLMDYLDNSEGFSTLVLLLRATGLDRRLKNTDLPHTLLAPSDDAFHQMGQNIVFKLLENLHLARDLLRMHLLSDAVCCSRLKSDLLSGRPYIRAIDGSMLWLERQHEDVVRIGGSQIVDCDIITSNGVIHMVDAIVRHEDVEKRTGGYKDSVFVRI